MLHEHGLVERNTLDKDKPSPLLIVQTHHGVRMGLREMRGLSRKTSSSMHQTKGTSLKLQVDNYISLHLGTLMRLSLCVVTVTSSQRCRSTITDIKPLRDLFDVRKMSSTHHHSLCRYKATTGKVKQSTWLSVFCVWHRRQVWFQTLCCIIGGMKRQQSTVRLAVFEQLQPLYIVCCYGYLSREEDNFNKIQTITFRPVPIVYSN